MEGSPSLKTMIVDVVLEGSENRPLSHQIEVDPNQSLDVTRKMITSLYGSTFFEDRGIQGFMNRGVLIPAEDEPKKKLKTCLIKPFPEKQERSFRYERSDVVREVTIALGQRYSFQTSKIVLGPLESLASPIRDQIITALKENFEDLEKLLSANVGDLVDDWGKNLLHSMAEEVKSHNIPPSRQVPILNLLLKSGSKPDAVDDRFMTPLHYFCSIPCQSEDDQTRICDLALLLIPGTPSLDIQVLFST
eukprot:TRINITY_DN1958_c1_g1_i2.p1 TRINITY_DN1958_c1_g1~~TRINITY_DN1958_c1_g1_i2.p1  ORF type:complete len:248 (-),score=61.38 TRINITY_DN1958_c1_g1_i2:80-823(-)